ncbi:MAG TPA: Uma2 family endonuclease [Gammaproteobacteria bacterium]|nr:Uma2 family endonuclease [Gammaproteobacteria bacterium]
MGMHMESWPRRHRITVHDYHRMAETGVLAPDARVELIEGEIIDMAPIGNDHQSIVDQLTRALVKAVGDNAIVRVQGSVRLSEWSEPQPDLLLLAPRADFYRSQFALGTDTLLLIEVSDTTLRYDRDVKVPLYARHGVPEAWIVDVNGDALLVYGDLRNGKYDRHVALERPTSAPITHLPGVTLDVAALFAH